MVELKLEMLNHSLPILYGTMNPFHPANLLRYVKRVGVEKSTTYTMLKRLCGTWNL